jgi:alanyl-tRNA synthetase
MTDRAYYLDSYTRTFSAQVRRHTTHNNKSAVILDKTYFYPTSGGQPNDMGTLNGVAVEDVVVDEATKDVLHMLAAPLTNDDVQAELNWPRRFDHMQHHSGQHILSRAFLNIAEAATIGFHLGADTVTIDLDNDKLSAATIERAEVLANEVVAANHTVRAWFPTPDELAQLVLRKTPDVDGPLRVVSIGDFDQTACGGTHVRQTAEVGPIKILKIEKQKKGTRVEFICGQRALTDYARKHGIVTSLAADFTCGVPDVPEVVGRQRAENQSLRKDLQAAKAELLDYEAARLLAGAVEQNGLKLISQSWPGRDTNDLRGLASKLAAATGVVALLGAPGDKAVFVFARSADINRDMGALFKQAIGLLTGARGGGSPAMAQGGGVAATQDDVNRVLGFAQKELLNA